MRLIDADMEVTAQLFDDMHEEYREEKMPISAFLDLYTNEGCPSAEPKQGEWIETEFLKLRECSCCHVRWGMYDVENFNFCPNCGADMRGEQDE